MIELFPKVFFLLNFCFVEIKTKWQQSKKLIKRNRLRVTYI